MDFSSDELIAIGLILFNYKSKKNKNVPKKYKTKKFWIRDYYKTREQTGAHKHVFQTLKFLDDPMLFKTYMRMSSTQLEQLLLWVGPKIEKQEVMRQPISASSRLVITLRFLATGESQQSLSLAFKCSRTSVHNIIFETSIAISDVLKDIVFPKLNCDYYKSIAMGFQQKWNFPNCIGAIDGKHITIEAPAKSGSEFFNYKKCYSLVLLAIADFDYSFMMCDIGAAGRQSDGGIFRHSQFGKKFYSNSLDIPKSCNVADDFKGVPFVFVADDAFSLTMNMMKPYSKQKLTITERIFNYRLSRARRIIENTFGILSTKWRIFRTTIHANPELVENIIEACVCLHNWLRQQNSSHAYITNGLADYEDEDGILHDGSWRKETNNFLPLEANNTNSPTCAKELRNEFAKYFLSSGAVDWQYNKI